MYFIEIITIISLNLILYLRTMRFILVADDLAWYQKHKNGFIKWPEIFSYGTEANLPKWTLFKMSLNRFKQYILDRLYGSFTFGTKDIFKPFKLFGKEHHFNAVAIDHLLKISLHTIICVMIYKAFGSNQVSFWAAILYTCNPLNNQTSMWLNGRRYAINIILTLGMIMVLNVKYGWAYAVILYGLTSLFHMTAIFAPVLLIAKYPWILLAIPLLYAVTGRSIVDKVRRRSKIIHDADHVKFTPKRLIIIVKNYGHFFWKIPFPGMCAFIYPMLHFWGQSEAGNKDGYSLNWHFWRGISAGLISGAGLWWFSAQNSPQMVCFWAFMCLSILQWCSIIAIVQDLADRYAGIGTVFGMFFLSYFVHLWAGPYALAILTGFACYYVPMLLTVMRMYRSEGTRWAYQRYFFPALPNPLKFENEFLIHDRHNPMAALVYIQEHLRYGGKDFDILYQAAKCHLMVGDTDGAKKYAKLASENYHIGKESFEAKKIENFLRGSEPPSGSIVGVPSRQVKRAEERKAAK